MPKITSCSLRLNRLAISGQFAPLTEMQCRVERRGAYRMTEGVFFLQDAAHLSSLFSNLLSFHPEFLPHWDSSISQSPWEMCHLFSHMECSSTWSAALQISLPSILNFPYMFHVSIAGEFFSFRAFPSGYNTHLLV